MLDIDVNSLKNQYTENALLAKKEGFKIYLFGAGIVGQIVESQFLEPYGIKADFFVEADEYYKESRKVCGIPVIPYSKLDKTDEKILLMICYDYSSVDGVEFPSFPIKGKVFCGDVGSFEGIRYDGIPDANYFNTEKKYFEDFYDFLADKESQIVMEAILKSRITSDCSYLKDIWREDQYFDSSVVDLNSIKNYVDCGAYTGDTYDKLLNKCKNGVQKAWLLEPDKENLIVLNEKYQKNENVTIIPKGAWNEKTVLHFSGSGGSTFVCGKNAGIQLEVDTIDNILNGQEVDFIKMDIEGSEYNALLGAERSVKAFEPVLAICVYHKRDDLIKIPNLIKSFSANYNFYLRLYKPYSLELVLYAVKRKA